jgi:hypothetical protein
VVQLICSIYSTECIQKFQELLRDKAPTEFTFTEDIGDQTNQTILHFPLNQTCPYYCCWASDRFGRIYTQGRIQSRRQPAPGHPFGSLKNKDRMVKNKIFFGLNILFIWTGHPLSIVSSSAPVYTQRNNTLICQFIFLSKQLEKYIYIYFLLCSLTLQRTRLLEHPVKVSTNALLLN